MANEFMKKDKPIYLATLGDLQEMFGEMFAPPNDYLADPYARDVKRHFVYGLAGLAKLLGVCKATASSIKRSGILDPAISQHGKVIVVDADLALELMKINKRVSNRRKH